MQDVYGELQSMGVDIAQLKRTDISDAELHDLAAGLRRLLKRKGIASISCEVAA